MSLTLIQLDLLITPTRKLNLPVKSLFLSWDEHSFMSMSLTSVAAGAGGWASGGMSTSVALLELWLVPSITICGGCESPPLGAITPAVGTAPFPNCHETHNTNTSFDNHRPKVHHILSLVVGASGRSSMKFTPLVLQPQMWLLYHLMRADRYAAWLQWNWQWETEVFRKKPTPLSLVSPQSHRT